MYGEKEDCTGEWSCGESGGVTLPRLRYGGSGDALAWVPTVLGDEADRASEAFLARSNIGEEGGTSATVRIFARLGCLIGAGGVMGVRAFGA